MPEHRRACKSIKPGECYALWYCPILRSVGQSPLEVSQQVSQESRPARTMFSVTLLQILLVLLSAYWQMDALRYYDLNNFPLAEIDQPASICQSNVEIVNWINEQMVRNAKLTGVNQRLSKILDTLNSSIYGKIPEEHCCFHEKFTMEKIMRDLSNISSRDGIEITNPLVSTGDLGEDLDLILDRMRTVIGNRTLSCCDHLINNLKETENNLLSKLDDLRSKFNNEKANMMGHTDGIKQQQTNLESELQNITKQLHNLDNRGGKDEEEKAKCCKELNNRVDDFEKQLEAAKGEADDKAKSLESQIKDLSKTQDEHEIQLNNMTKIMENNIEVVVKVTEDCKKIVTNITEIQGSGNMAIDDNLKKELHELKNKVSNITAEVEGLQNISKSLDVCDLLNNDIDKLKETIDTVEENLPAPDYSTLTQLQQEIVNAQLCCKKVDKIDNEAIKLKEKIDQLNASYNNQSSKIALTFVDLENQINYAHQKLNEYFDLSTLKNNATINAMGEHLQVMQGQIVDMIHVLTVTKEKMDMNKGSIKDLEDQLNKLSRDLKKLHENRIKAANAYKEEVEMDFNELYGELDKCATANDQDLEQCLSEFRIKYNELYQMITKVLSVESKLTHMDKQLNDLIAKFKTNEKRIDQCTEKCKDMKKLDELINRIEELEEISGHGSSKQPGIAKKTALPKKTTKPPNNKIAGMYGSVDNAIPFYS